MAAICYIILKNRYVKLGWIIILFADPLIFWDNGILQLHNLWSVELENSTWEYLIIVGLFFCQKSTTLFFYI